MSLESSKKVYMDYQFELSFHLPLQFTSYKFDLFACSIDGCPWFCRKKRQSFAWPI